MFTKFIQLSPDDFKLIASSKWAWACKVSGRNISIDVNIRMRQSPYGNVYFDGDLYIYDGPDIYNSQQFCFKMTFTEMRAFDTLLERINTRLQNCLNFVDTFVNVQDFKTNRENPRVEVLDRGY